MVQPMIPRRTSAAPPLLAFPSPSASSIYKALLAPSGSAKRDTLEAFLRTELAKAENLPCDVPGQVEDLSGWVALKAADVAEHYNHYLKGRHAGTARRFFKTKAQALHFLRSVAPSKLVDGAWLYGTLKHAKDCRYHGLIRTYLEELGDGDPALNHVTLYRQLLVKHDCEPEDDLDEALYLQGALQLALGELSDEFFPEVIGYNLGYEQLPLHLLITAFELNELGIDPYYFTLHVTIDNASTGHARKAIKAIENFLPGGGANEQFFERVRAGYRLNELGTGSMAVIEGFSLENETVKMLERKRSFGQSMHSDYCRLEGKTVNEWLVKPGQCRAFLQALESSGWIKRHEDPRSSRFWQLIDGPGAAMFGVFNGYEKQLLKDWIAGDWVDPTNKNNGSPFRARFRMRRQSDQLLAPARIKTEPLQQLLKKMSPAQHTSPSGLEATRIYARQLATGINE
jgi:hypothetical protein